MTVRAKIRRETEGQDFHHAVDEETLAFRIRPSLPALFLYSPVIACCGISGKCKTLITRSRSARLNFSWCWGTEQQVQQKADLLSKSRTWDEYSHLSTSFVLVVSAGGAQAKTLCSTR